MEEWTDFRAQVDGLRDAAWRWGRTDSGTAALQSPMGQDAVALLRQSVSGGTEEQAMRGFSLLAELSGEPELILRYTLAAAAINAARGASLDSMGLGGCEGWLSEVASAVESGNLSAMRALIAEIVPRAMAYAMMLAIQSDDPVEAFFGG